MSKLWSVGLLLLSPLCFAAQDEPPTLDDLMESADRWAKENLDEDSLRLLDTVDRDKVKRFFRDIERQFRSEYVLDLAALKDTANAVIPLLEEYEETQPYAAWLKARLVYLDVADE